MEENNKYRISHILSSKADTKSPTQKYFLQLATSLNIWCTVQFLFFSVFVCLLIVCVCCLYSGQVAELSEETWMQPSGRVKKPYPSISPTHVKSTTATGEFEACRSLHSQTGAPLGSSSQLMTLRPCSGSKGLMQLACHSAQSQRVLVQLQFMQTKAVSSLSGPPWWS